MTMPAGEREKEEAEAFDFPMPHARQSRYHGRLDTGRRQASARTRVRTGSATHKKGAEGECRTEALPRTGQERPQPVHLARVACGLLGGVHADGEEEHDQDERLRRVGVGVECGPGRGPEAVLRDMRAEGRQRGGERGQQMRRRAQGRVELELCGGHGGGGGGDAIGGGGRGEGGRYAGCAGCAGCACMRLSTVAGSFRRRP